jgi:hypothetical protein
MLSEERLQGEGQDPRSPPTGRLRDKRFPGLSVEMIADVKVR